MRKFVCYVISVIFSLAVPMTSLGATIDDFDKVKNGNILSEEKLNHINDGIRDIPDYVIELYNKVGGTLEFTNKVLGGNKNINGMYWLDGSDIQVRSSNDVLNNSSYAFRNILAHELGHFVYYMTYGNWKQETKDELHKVFEYWNQYAPECYDEVETFAEIYAWEMTGNDQWNSHGEKEIVTKANSIVRELNARMEEGGFGPGFEKKLGYEDEN
jgi:hypothetical protein